MDRAAKASLLYELSRAIAEAAESVREGPFESTLLANDILILKALRALL
jgi:hypothetical protein